MALFSETSRSKFESTAYTALLLAFFFAVGLAGGVLYRLLPTTTRTEVTAQTVRPQSSTAPAPAPAAPVKAAEAASAAAVPTVATASAKPAAPKADPTPPVVAAAAKPAATKADAPPPAAPATAKPATAKIDAAPTIVASTSVVLPVAAASMAGEAPSMTGAMVPLSAPVTAPIPPATTPVASDPTAARPVADAKPSAAPKPKAAPEKRVAAVTKMPAPPPAAESATGGPVRVQFGAFTIEDNAHETQWAVEATGLPVEITQATTRKGHVLFYVRSQPFADRAAALSAAAAARQKAKSFVNPVDIDYVIVADTAPQQQAQAAAH